MTHENAENLYPLSYIAQQLDVSEKQLTNWATPSQRQKNNGFPEPVMVGRYAVYDIDEVKEWYMLWRRVTANYRGHFKKT